MHQIQQSWILLKRFKVVSFVSSSVCKCLLKHFCKCRVEAVAVLEMKAMKVFLNSSIGNNVR